MEHTSKIMKNKEIRKVQSKGTKRRNENTFMVQLHHFANLTKSTTATKASTLNLSSESKALLENDFFKLLNSKNRTNTEFVASPFIINNNNNSRNDIDFGNKIYYSVPLNSNKNNFHDSDLLKDLVAKNFKSQVVKDPFAIACRDINSMIKIKDYNRIFRKNVEKSRKFINGLLVYGEQKQHYSGASVSRICLRKNFKNRLEKATNEIFPEMDPKIGTKDLKEENLFLQNVIDFYESREQELLSFNEHFHQGDEVGTPPGPNDDIVFECDEDIINRPVTPENEYFGPESYTTPPTQRLIPFDFSSSTISKYQTVFYEKDTKNGKAQLFEVPQYFDVNKKSVKINRSDLRCIHLNNDNDDDDDTVMPSVSSKMKSRVEKARLIASGKLKVIDTTESGVSKKPKKIPKRCLFRSDLNNCLDFGCRPLPNDNSMFVRPLYSPKEFSRTKKRNTLCSPQKSQSKFLQTLKVDELDDLKKISRVKTPEHRYVPFIQFDRK